MPQRTQLTLGRQRRSAEAALRERRAPVRSLYLHIPFCFHKCHYCDFYSLVDGRDRQPAFAEAMARELRALAGRALEWEPERAGGRIPLETLFVGGGTPSLLAPELWRHLLGVLHEHFEIGDRTEFTVECNPETVTPELMAILGGGGVNRVSIGAQSFDRAHLKTLERWHDPENIARALEIASAVGIARRSIDLIYGVPGQSLADWMADLELALGLSVGGRPAFEHISCYALTYEPSTALTARLRRGEFQRIEEDVEAEMFERTVDVLRSAGLERYEVSNFARPGAECRHNLAYWRQAQWLAAGPSASAHLHAPGGDAGGGWRWKNIPALDEWMGGVEASGGFSPVADLEPPDPRRAVAERVMTGLRLREGIGRGWLAAQGDRFAAADALGRCIDRQAGAGMFLDDDDNLRLSDRGFLFADAVAADLMSVFAG